MAWLLLLFGRGDALGVLLIAGGVLTITPYQGVVDGRTCCWQFTIVIARTRISFGRAPWPVLRSAGTRWRWLRWFLWWLLWIVVVVVGPGSGRRRCVLRRFV